MQASKLVITSAENDLLITQDGRRLIDLFCGGGSVFLGHANPSINRRLKDQLEKLWNAGALNVPVRTEARMQIERFFPEDYALAGLYSTGMEVAEFAIRVARTITGKKGIAGFEGSMHGKSMATSTLGWENDLISLPEIRRLPNIPLTPEDEVLDGLHSALRGHQIGAVFVEPLLGTSGGHTASPRFYQQLSELCSEYEALLVVDEILTGFHRTGTPFMFSELGLAPEIVLFGKAAGNGFPVSGIMLDKKYSIEPAMLPNSTFAGNPLAAAVISGTLQAMQDMDMSESVSRIHDTITTELGELRNRGISLRGKGALWVLEFPSEAEMLNVAAALLDEGLLVSPTRNVIRLLPPATITEQHLLKTCDALKEACRHG